MPYDLNYSGEMQDETNYVAWLMMLFTSARMDRINFESMWEESAALCWPEYRNSFSFGHQRAPGQKYTEFQVDTAGSIASHRFMAIADAVLTPYNMDWSPKRANDRSLMRQRRVKLYYDELNQVCWQHRYRWDANFISQNQTNWQALGVFGNVGMFVEELAKQPGKFTTGLSYVATSPGEMYKLKNYQGRTTGFIRHFRWTARMAFDRWGMVIPRMLKSALDKADNFTRWDFLQFVLPNTEYDPLQIFNSVKSNPWVSVYICVAGQCIMEMGGYRTFPWASGGYIGAPEESYERGPGQMVLPELKTLNSEKAMFLRQGHKAAEPAYLIADDGLNQLKIGPNAMNYGGMSADGTPLAAPLATGNIQVTPEMMAMSKEAVDDAFLTSLFPILAKDAEQGEKGGRQIIEEAGHRGIFLGPLARQYGEYLGALNQRELDVLAYLRKLPKLPPELVEAAGEYETVYTSPLAKMMEGNQAIAGFMRSVEFGRDVVNITQDQSVMDVFDFDEALPEIADMQMSPSRWMATAEKIAQKRKARQQAAERDRQVKEMPGKAAMAKAQAIQTKATTGGNTGGTLSGVPTGQMPMMPGQTAPGGRAFGQPGG